MSEKEVPERFALEQRALAEETHGPRPPGGQGALNNQNDVKPGWQRFLESTGGTAFITVVIGGILGQRITSSYQEKLKDRDIAVAFYHEQSKERQDIGARYIELVGGCMGTSQDLIALTEQGFDPDQFKGQERKKVVQQRTEIRKKYNELDSRWAVEGAQLGLLIALHGHDQQGLTQGWRRVQQSVAAYKQCAENWYSQHQGEFVALDVARAACAKEKSQASIDVDGFTEQIGEAWRNPTPNPQIAR